MTKITQLDEADLEEAFSRASGPGGQNVNKVASRVVLRHVPTNVTVTIADSRSQAANRKLARERLLAALQARQAEAISTARQAREKLRRQNAPRPRKVTRRILEAKSHQSRRKQERRRVDD